MDERVAMAISHWAPRFTMNGVTAGDFERITSGLTSWNDWCAAWSKVAAEHESLGREALDGNLCRCGTHGRVVAAVLRAAGTGGQAVR